MKVKLIYTNHAKERWEERRFESQGQMPRDIEWGYKSTKVGEMARIKIQGKQCAYELRGKFKAGHEFLVTTVVFGYVKALRNSMQPCTANVVDLF